MKDEIRDSVIDNVRGSDYHSGILGSGGRETVSVQELEKLLTVQDISSLLGVKKSYVYHLTNKKRIPHIKINGHHLRFRRSDIDEWLQSQEVQIDSKEKRRQERY